MIRKLFNKTDVKVIDFFIKRLSSGVSSIEGAELVRAMLYRDDQRHALFAKVAALNGKIAQVFPACSVIRASSLGRGNRMRWTLVGTIWHWKALRKKIGNDVRSVGGGRDRNRADRSSHREQA